MGVDLSKATVFKELQDSDQTAMLARKLALRDGKTVVVMRELKHTSFPILECSPQGDLAEVHGETLKANGQHRMAWKWAMLLQDFQRKFEAGQSAAQLDRKLVHYRQMGHMAEVAAEYIAEEAKRTKK